MPATSSDQYYITGPSVIEGGNPVVGRIVYCYKRSDGTVAGQDTTDSNGDWSIGAADQDERFVIMIDPAEGATDYSPDCDNRLRPVVNPSYIP